MSDTNSLSVCGSRFELQKGIISGWITDPYWTRTYAPDTPLEPKWGVELSFERGIIGDESYGPCVYHASLPFNLRNWRELSGVTCEWNEPMNKHNQPNGGFYLWQHGSILEAHLEISRIEGSSFRVEWNGVCETLLEAPIPSEANFSLIAEAEFTGIAVFTSECETEAEAHERFARHFEFSDFMPDPVVWQEQYKSGVKAGQIFFRPRLYDPLMEAHELK